MYTIVIALLSHCRSSHSWPNTEKYRSLSKLRLQCDTIKRKSVVYHSESSSSAQGEPALMWLRSSSMSWRM